MENSTAPPPQRAHWTLRLPRDRQLQLGVPPRSAAALPPASTGAPRIMGVLNLTPDSFSDGGLWTDPQRAVARGLEMLAEGADLLDLGAESTRPGGGVYGEGARTVTVDEELARLLPVLERLRAATDAPLSVDTRKGTVARAALAAGADLINDVSLLADADLARAAAEAGCPLVLMHSRGELATMQRAIAFRDLLGEVRSELADAADRAVALGVAREQIVLDPGVGFGKTAAQNLTLIRRLDAFADLGRPLLVGASRKSFLGALTGRPPAERLAGSLAALAWAAPAAAIVRVHDVAASAEFLTVWSALASSTESTGPAPFAAAGSAAG